MERYKYNYKPLFIIAKFCYIKLQYNNKTDHICIYLNIIKRSKKQIKLDSKRNHKQHKQILHNLKINGCAKCGYNKCDDVLDFHHVNPEDKKYQIVANNIR